MTSNAKAFLIPAAVGFVVAVGLGLLSRYGSFDILGWAVYVWPTALVLGGISGYSTVTTEIIAIAVSGFLNAAIYGVVGWVGYRIYHQIRRQQRSELGA